MNGQTDLSSFRSVEPPQCKNCGSSWTRKDGKYRGSRKQTYECRKCNCKFVFNQSDLKKMRYNSSVIAFAVELYTRSGVSLRTLSQYLKTHFDVFVSHETIREWMCKPSGLTQSNVSGKYIRTWMADETAIKINGRQHWLWCVFNPEHKLVLAWHISKTRTTEDAVILFEKSISATGQRPEKLITDQLPQYALALRLVLGRINTKHHQVEQLGANNGIERFFREVKRRTKWFSTFRAEHGANALLHLFFYCHNHIKPHKTLNRIPAEGLTIRQALKAPAKIPT